MEILDSLLSIFFGVMSIVFLWLALQSLGHLLMGRTLTIVGYEDCGVSCYVDSGDPRDFDRKQTVVYKKHRRPIYEWR